MSAPLLLIHPPCPDVPPLYFGPPYGIALLAACLLERGHDVLCRDFERSDESSALDAAARLIESRGVRCVGIGGTSASCGVIGRLVHGLRARFPELLIIVGGPYASDRPELLIDTLPVDYVVVGDGERSFPELVESLAAGNDAGKVAGLAFRRDGAIVRTKPRERVANPDELPYPALHLFEVERALAAHTDFLATQQGAHELRTIQGKRCTNIRSALMLMSSFGCVYACVFCPMSGVSGKHRHRSHSPSYFVDMLAHFAQRYGQRQFVFGDNLFTENLERARAICDAIVERDLDLEWTCMTRTDRVDEGLLQRMRAAGCIAVFFGVESCSESVQRAIRKKLDLSTVAPALEACDAAKIRSVVSLMVGNPGDNEETVRETLTMVRDLEPDEVQVKITKLYPGTALHAQAEQEGLIDDARYLEGNHRPLTNTLEQDEATVERLAAMIKPRTLLFCAAGRCQPGCDQCPPQPPAIERSREEVERDLLRLARRCSTLRFARGSLEHPHFDALLAYARKLRVPRIELELEEATAAVRCQQLLARGVDRLVFVADADAGAPGDPGRAASASAEINVARATLPGLRERIRMLAARGIDDFVFRYEPGPVAEKPVGAELAEVLRDCQRPELRFATIGLPYCALTPFESAVDELQRPFDELCDLHGRLRNVGKERRARRQQLASCDGCEFTPRCEGFWKVHSSRAQVSDSI